MSDISIDQKSSLHNFLWWAVAIGGVAPLIIIGAVHSAAGGFGSADTGVVPHENVARFISFCLLFAVTVFAVIAILTKFLDENRLSVVIPLAAFVSLICLHAFVKLTGGSTVSYWSFHYLFLPTVVAMTFKDNVTVYGTALVCLLSCIVNLRPWLVDPGYLGYFMLTTDNETAMKSLLTNSSNSYYYLLAYILIFVVQLLVSVHLAKRAA